MHQISDFRSDTVTRPTPAMYEAMQSAPLGDDVLGDEPTINELEIEGAKLLGKEAALFCPSGVMANQIAIRIHTRPGDEVICEAACHTYNNETGAIAGIAGAQVRPIASTNGMPAIDEIIASIQDSNVHHPRTSLVTLENTHNGRGGRVLPQDQVIELSKQLKALGLPFHLDGARLANASVASGKSIAELAAPFDSVAFCLSKGLGSPVGSLIAGSKSFIHEARRIRKMLGGGMRQAGILAACGLVSIRSMVERLAEDHALAKQLGEGLKTIDGIEVDLDAIETNILYFKVPGREAEFASIREKLAERGVLALYLDAKTWRMVTHYDVDAGDVEKSIDAWRAVMAE